MKKLATFVLSAFLLAIFAMPSFALHGISADELEYKGLSPYMVEILELQESRHENNMVFETPSRNKTFWRNIFRGDMLWPTQEFGYYNITDSF